MARIELGPTVDALAEADTFVASAEVSDLREQLERVAKLIQGFQSPFGMELLATVHWVATQAPNVESASDAVRGVHDWSERKATIFLPIMFRSPGSNRLIKVGFPSPPLISRLVFAFY